MSLLANFEGIVRPLFIETGTSTGNTLDLARTAFDRCISIEYAESYYRQAMERFKDAANVKLYRGDSGIVLREVIEPNVPTTFWLDAHYFENADTLGPTGQCPLMAELRAITSAKWETPPIILIDDGYMFDDRIPHPGSIYSFWTSNESSHTNYNRRHWPKIEEIDELLVGYHKAIRNGTVLEYR